MNEVEKSRGAPLERAMLQDIAEGLVFQFGPEFWIRHWSVICLSLAYFGAGGLFLSRYISTQKQRAYVPSVLSSTFLFLTSCAHTAKWLTRVGGQGFEESAPWLAGKSPLADNMMVFFLTFLWLDLALTRWFPGHMEFCAGWVHHLVYITLISNSLYWGFTNSIAVMFVQELPTAILGLGQLFPDRFRSEKGFGFTFAALRLLYHLFPTTVTFLYCRDRNRLWLAGTLAMCVHSWWFAGWIRRQRRLRQYHKALSKPLAHLSSSASTVDTPRDAFGGREALH